MFRSVALLFTLAIAIAQAVAASIGTSISSDAGEASSQRSHSCSALTQSVMLSQLREIVTTQLEGVWALGAIAHPLSRGDCGSKPIYINLFTQEASQGTYFDISRGSSNLLESPDLRKFDQAERKRRLESWKELTIRPLSDRHGQVNNSQLGQRVEQTRSPGCHQNTMFLGVRII